MITRVTVNRHVIAANRKHGRSEPVFTVKASKGSTRARQVEFAGPGRLVERPEKPLDCGATIWFGTESPVVIS